MCRFSPPAQGKRESAQQKKREQTTATSHSKGSSDWNELKTMLYSGALEQFVHMSVGTPNLGGTQHFAGQHLEKAHAEAKSALNKEQDDLVRPLPI